MLAGADGYKRRWIVALDVGDGTTRLEVVDSFGELIARGEIERIVIDVPIGLPDTGARRCDELARKMIGPRRSSVFPAPVRPMLRAQTYDDACRIRRRVDGKGCSRQLFAILPAIRSVDSLMSAELQSRVREGHPEVSFTALAGAPMTGYKASARGVLERLSALRAVFPDMEERIRALEAPVGLADVLDAYSLLWTARRIHTDEASSLTEPAQFDGTGLRMEIVY